MTPFKPPLDLDDCARIYELGMEALRKELGVAGALRFLSQIIPGRGDYTAERHAYLDGMSIDDIALEIEKKNGARAAGQAMEINAYQQPRPWPSPNAN